MQIEELKKAHNHSIKNENEVLASQICGCFYCIKFFKPNQIKLWIEDTKRTARCPYCDVDAVIGDASGYTLTNEFLNDMHNKWFN